MTTVTLPREVVQQALDALDVAQSLCESWKSNHHSKMLTTYNALRAALDAPAKPVDCRGCANIAHREEGCLLGNCTDFDKFTALPPIVLTKVTK